VTQALCSALAGLRDLTDLTLHSHSPPQAAVAGMLHKEPVQFPVPLAAAVGQLQHLTYLYA
jgi:hypothetical protein